MAFYRHDGAHYQPSVLTRGPWHAEHQHGGPPSALLTGALQHDAPSGMHLARLTVTFLAPVPLAPLSCRVTRWEGGRTVRRGWAELLHDGRTVLRAEGLFVRHLDVGDPPGPLEVPPPETTTPWAFPFFPWTEGYHQAIDTRIVDGRWPATPLTAWVRLRPDIVQGVPTTPQQRVVAIVDAQSGLGPPARVDDVTFVNPDLTVVFARVPQGDWLGLTVRGFVGDRGAGLAEAALFDTAGPLGRSVQTVVVAPRGSS